MPLFILLYFRDCNSQPNNDLDSQQTLTNPLSSNSVTNGAGEQYRSNQGIISAVNDRRSRGGGCLGATEPMSSYFSNTLENIHLDQQQHVQRPNDSNTCDLKGE